MSRLILVAILILALVVAASAVASVFRNTPQSGTGRTQSGAIPKVAFGLLMVVMLGVGSGMMGAN